ncbi:MAG: TIR domain-containing protein [Coriobacteriales bacterium]|jgi:hypothetical protein|nr:TIR domain-containing protein [Coriobacteriales bacterium]
MSAGQARREINRLDNDIAVLEKKRAELEQKEAEKARRINDVQKSITKNTSASTLSSKSKQIRGYQTDIAKLSKNKVDTTRKIADKQKKRAEKAAKLRSEEAVEKKKEVKTQQTIQRGYERRIKELAAQVHEQNAVPLAKQNSLEGDSIEYDVFVSHAWEDKSSFVDEFVSELLLLGIRAWYDTQQMAWGDSMRERIDKGLGNARFGVAIISPSYIAKDKYWTKTELDGLFQLESVNGKMLLPIWHDITKKEVMEYSPIVAGRLAMTTATMTPKEIAEELAKMLGESYAEELA